MYCFITTLSLEIFVTDHEELSNPVTRTTCNLFIFLEAVNFTIVPKLIWFKFFSNQLD